MTSTRRLDGLRGWQRWLAGLAALGLAACTLAPTPAPPLTAPPSEAPVAGAVSFMVFGDPAELRAYEQVVAAFEAAQPAVDVTLIHIPGQNDYRTRLAADFAAGDPADVVLINYRRVPGFASRGLLEPLGPSLLRSRVLAPDDFYPEAYYAFYWQGELMCVPQNVSSLVVYYNRDLFKTAGLAEPADDWDWDAFLQTAQALTRDLDGDGQIDQYGLGVEPELQRLAPFLWQNGGLLTDNFNEPHQLALTDTKSLAALEWFVDLQLRHHVVPDAAAAQAEDSETRFLNGRAGMYLNSRRIVPTLRESAAFDWDVAPLPSRAGQRATILHADGYCLAATAANKAAAWAFIEFANGPVGQPIVAATGRTVPSLRAVAESAAFLDPAQKPARSQVFLDQIEFVMIPPLIPNWADIEEVANAELERAFYGQVSALEAARTAGVRAAEYFEQEP